MKQPEPLTGEPTPAQILAARRYWAKRLGLPVAAVPAEVASIHVRSKLSAEWERWTAGVVAKAGGTRG